MDLLAAIFGEFVQRCNDRRYADDAALVAGFAKLDEREVAVISQQKGRDTNQKATPKLCDASPYRKKRCA